MLKTGFQYEAVDSITTCVTPSRFSQSCRLSSSATTVPKRRFCARAPPSRGPVIAQTARNVFPTSIPAHRSTAAQIISVLPSGRRTADIFTNIFFLGSTAPFGDSICRLDQFFHRLRLLHYADRPPFSCLGHNLAENEIADHLALNVQVPLLDVGS